MAEAIGARLPIQSLLEDVANTFESRTQKALAWDLGVFFNFQRRSAIRRAKRVAPRQAG